MKYPKYGDWCKDCVIETIRKQKIHDTKTYLNNLVFNPNSDLYLTGVYDYEVSDILWIINSDPDLSKSLFSAVQHAFAEKYFQIAQEINPQMDMKAIRHNGGEYTDFLYRALVDITIDQLRDAVMFAYEYGTEKVEESRIPYANTITESIARLLKNSLVELEYVHINYLDPDAQRKDISIDSFTDYLMHLSQSGIFADTINWRYVDLFDNGKFLIEGDIGHNNGYELNVGIAAKNIEDKDKVIEILKVRNEVNERI